MRRWRATGRQPSEGSHGRRATQRVPHSAPRRHPARRPDLPATDRDARRRSEAEPPGERADRAGAPAWPGAVPDRRRVPPMHRGEGTRVDRGARVVREDLDDLLAFKVAFVHNVVRKNLRPLDRANAIRLALQPRAEQARRRRRARQVDLRAKRAALRRSHGTWRATAGGGQASQPRLHTRRPLH